MIWCDTSFLLSLYIRDANAARATAAMQSISEPLAYTSLHRLEARNGIRLAVFRSQINNAQWDLAFQDIRDDLRRGVLQRTAISWRLLLRQAEALGAAHTESLGNRTIDILHVAAAMTIGAQEFLTFDTRQRALAGVVGLRVGS